MENLHWLNTFGPVELGNVHDFRLFVTAVLIGWLCSEATTNLCLTVPRDLHVDSSHGDSY